MKKNYMTPMVTFQNFSATSTVSTGCIKKANHAADDCQYLDPELDLWLFTEDNCEMPYECYFPSAMEEQIFSS